MASELPKRTRPHASRGPARRRSPRTLRAAPHAAERPARPGALLLITRHGVPGLVVLAGVVAMCFGTTASLVGGGALIGAGLASWLIAWLYRVGIEGDRARVAEERARRYFERHGRWPDA